MATVIALVLVTMLFYSFVHGHDHSQMEKVLVLSKRFQEVLFTPENSQTLYNMREVFFPSSRYRFWQPDNTEIIDIEICLNIVSTGPCLARVNTNITRCSVYRWTNSYFLNLIDIRQLYSFELLTTSALFGTIARGHRNFDRLLILTLAVNLPCDGLSGAINDATINQALVQFLSWVKLYAQSQQPPTYWEGKEQGYVTRKYDYITVDLFHFDDLSELSYKSTLVCFVFFNVLTTYLLMRNASLINTQLSIAACRKDHGRHITKGFTLQISLLVSAYILGTTSVYLKDPTLKLSSPCNPQNQDSYYSCVPESEFEKEHKKQVWSLVVSVILRVSAMLLYAVCSVYIVKTSRRPGIVFQRGWLRCIEVYLLWSVLMAIHIGIGLAGLPILIFTILIPMYTVFFVSSWIIGLGIIALPFIIAFYLLDLIKQGIISKIKLCLHSFELVFTYLMGSGVTIALLILYYLFLAGGASMAGFKGTVFSLVPPLVISVAVVIIKAKVTANNNKETIELLDDEPLIGF